MPNRREYKKGELVKVIKKIDFHTLGWQKEIKLGKFYLIRKPLPDFPCPIDIIQIEIGKGLGYWWIPFECIEQEAQMLFSFMYNEV